MKRMIGLVILLITPLFSFSQENEFTSFVLSQGDNYTIHGVRIEFALLEKPNPRSAPNALIIKFNGPDSGEREFRITGKFDGYKSTQEGIDYEQFPLCLDKIVFLLSLSSQNDKYLLKGSAKRQPDTFLFPGIASQKKVFVSDKPILLDNYLILSVSKKNATNETPPDLELQILDKSTNKTESMSLVEGVNKQINRFDIMIKQVCKETMTTLINISANEDYSNRGKNTLIRSSEGFPQNITYGDLIEQLSKKYEFEVEWTVPDDYPEIFPYLQQKQIFNNSFDPDPNDGFTPPFLKDGCILDDAIHRFSNYLQTADQPKVEWVNDYHLRIDTTPIKALFASRKIQEEAVESRKKAHQESLEQFQRLFQLETQVYPLQTITPITAKLLVDSHLNCFFSIEKGIKAQLQDMIGETYHGNEHYFIASASPKMMRGLKDAGNNLKTGDAESAAIITINSEQFVREEAIADEKGNVLIVNAIPKTHEKVMEVLKQVDQRTGDEKSKGIQQYKIEIVLVAGDTPKDVTGTVEQAFKNAELLKKYGIDEIDVRLLDIRSLKELSKSIIPLTGEKGEIGTAKVSLSDDYSCELSFLDLREPYLVVRGTLNHRVVDFLATPPTDATNLPEAKREEKEKVLLQNTLFLEKDKPTLLGVTNLNEALIMILRYVE